MVCAGEAIASAAQSKPATQTRRQSERPALQICFPESFGLRTWTGRSISVKVCSR
jgi:hypothetical protein